VKLDGDVRQLEPRDVGDLVAGQSFEVQHDDLAVDRLQPLDELREAFERPGFDEEKFLDGAQEMLDGVETFWDGLWEDRHAMLRAA